MQEDKTKGIHVIGVEVSDFHRIKFARVDIVPGVGVIRVTGKNKAGKTSLLRSIRAALGGAGEVLPASVNDDAEDGTAIVKLELDNGFTVTRRFTEANPKGYLTVTGPDGGKHSQARLNEWMGPFSFDPMAFFDLKPVRQTEILLSLGEDPDLAKKLKKLADDHATLYAERTPVIADQRRTKAVKRPDGERPEAVDVSAEMKRLDELDAAQDARGEASWEIDGFRARLTASKDAQKDVAQEIADLEAALADRRRTAEDLENAHATLLSDGKACKAKYEAMPDPTADIVAVKLRLSEADAKNRAIAPWTQWETAQADCGAATKTVEEYDAKMAALKKKEKALIAGAGIPVEGLSFSETGEPILNGRPLVVASGAERIALSVAVAQAVNPELRICLVDEANDLDLEALEALDAAAKDSGFQVWACRLGLEGRGEIVIENGYAQGPATENDDDHPAVDL